MSISRNRGRIGGDARTVKVLRLVFAGFRGRDGPVHKRFQRLIKGAFAADILGFAFRPLFWPDHAGRTGF
jgi:hypothetical protein